VRDDAIQRHCAEIDRCNQRGGRMLSIVDLIGAGTLGADLAAYALAAIGAGASFLVGARPGGAGKTTVMGALLNFVPADVPLAPAESMAAIQRGLQSPTPRRCYVCHEIGSGHWYAYLWGAELRAYLQLPEAGHMMATNLHADTYEQARQQIVEQNRVPEAAFRRMNLLFFLAVERSGFRIRRRLVTVWESDGQNPHRQVFPAVPSSSGVEPGGLVSPDAVAEARETIGRLLAGGSTIEEVRAAILTRTRGP